VCSRLHDAARRILEETRLPCRCQWTFFLPMRPRLRAYAVAFEGLWPAFFSSFLPRVPLLFGEEKSERNCRTSRNFSVPDGALCNKCQQRQVSVTNLGGSAKA